MVIRIRSAVRNMTGYFSILSSPSGMETRTFESAEDYLASGGEGAFDALLLDVELPGLSGFDLRRRLVSAGSGTADTMTDSGMGGAGG